MENFFALLSRMRYIKRWALMRSSQEENIMEHSQQVAVFTHALCAIENAYFGGKLNVEYAVMLALYHETSEVITGDLPTPIKYYNGKIKDAYKEIERTACEKVIAMLPEELKPAFSPYVLPQGESEEYRFMKYADKLSAYAKCLEEIKCGNAEFSSAKKAIEKELKSYKSQAVDYFIKHFLPGFSMTLDELNQAE
ncbi:MAG: 5'-deoxynucleotidase [Clostridia bacterium]|jgi:5'-deoxynucleotidase|nr:5'-deoxynucleotidase [Clostridia bacterium]MBQ1942498.1 5'-deoxynucleotidase [Clostridia bacterium]MBQ5801439.1 5'-deoxynucleotidase [Clostridia bacterium]